MVFPSRVSMARPSRISHPSGGCPVGIGIGFGLGQLGEVREMLGRRAFDRRPSWPAARSSSSVLYRSHAGPMSNSPARVTSRCSAGRRAGADLGEGTDQRRHIRHAAVAREPQPAARTDRPQRRMPCRTGAGIPLIAGMLASARAHGGDDDRRHPDADPGAAGGVTAGARASCGVSRCRRSWVTCSSACCSGRTRSACSTTTSRSACWPTSASCSSSSRWGSSSRSPAWSR